MNKNKILANTLCASMMITNITPAFATVTNETITFEDTTESTIKQTEVFYNKAGNYFVTIPKTISLGTDKQSPYSVKVEGDIPSDRQVYVSPIDSIKDTEELDFYMHDTNTANPKADVVATVTQNKFYWNFSEVANGYTETNNQITALDLTSGTWKGTFDFEINMHKVNGDESHTHSYTETIIKNATCTEDGEKELICSCGDTKTENIPATGHNYDDGSCKNCGEADPNYNVVDPYPLAPEDAYLNWNYTLDEIENTITLNYYSGSETNVIVYSAYPVNGTTYRTKIASNKSSTSVSKYMFTGNSSIQSIKFGENIDTSETISISRMFYGCGALTSLDVSSLDTSNVTDMTNMFVGCSSLTTLDLSNFDTSNVKFMNNIFYGCSSLKTIYVSSNKWSTSQADTTGMFTNCGTSSVTYK